MVSWTKRSSWKVYRKTLNNQGKTFSFVKQVFSGTTIPTELPGWWASLSGSGGMTSRSGQYKTLTSTTWRTYELGSRNESRQDSQAICKGRVVSEKQNELLYLWKPVTNLSKNCTKWLSAAIKSTGHKIKYQWSLLHCIIARRLQLCEEKTT